MPFLPHLLPFSPPPPPIQNLMLQDRKLDLEKQTRQLREENDSIQALVDTLHDNLLLLRKESHEKELQVCACQRPYKEEIMT